MPKTPRAQQAIDVYTTSLDGAFRHICTAMSVSFDLRGGIGKYEDLGGLLTEITRLMEDANRIPRAERTHGQTTWITGRARGHLHRD
jgi:hypothetical protein